MGLFDKKYCDICGEKIGLLGNRKLEDGNLCKTCAKKLSPWFSERRSSTVEKIKEQLDWREKNRERAAQFCITRSFGEGTRLLLDETHQWFAVTRAKNPAEDNADVLDFSTITGCRADIDERRTELKMETKDCDGNIIRKSYSPPRYEYDYNFHITVSVNVPFFDEMKFQLNDYPVHVPFRPTRTEWAGGFRQAAKEEPMYDPYYRGYKDMCDELCGLLEHIRGNASGVPGAAVAANAVKAEEGAAAQLLKDASWVCKSCGWLNHGTSTCYQCGGPVSDERLLANIKAIEYAESIQKNGIQSWSCPSCGAENVGKFCENCGTKRPDNI